MMLPLFTLSMNQEKFDLIISTTKNWLCGAQLKLNTKRTDILNVVKENLKMPIQNSLWIPIFESCKISWLDFRRKTFFFQSKSGNESYCDLDNMKTENLLTI